MRSLKKLDMGFAKITDEGVAHLAQIKTLEYLELPSRGITDKGLAYLTDLTKLKHLHVPRGYYVDPNMDKNYYTDKGLEELSKVCSLEELDIGSIGITDVGMEHLAKLTNLRELGLFGCTNVNGKGFAKLSELHNLQTLYIFYTSVTLSELSCLNTLKNLRKLSVNNMEHRGKGNLDISGLKNLEELQIYLKVQRVRNKETGDPIYDDDLKCLTDLKNLRSLYLDSVCEITDKGMVHLAGLTNLESFGLNSPNLTDDELRYLTNMRKLDTLWIYGGNFTDKGLQYLHGLKSLRVLDIIGENDFSRQALAHLHRELPNLYSFNIDDKHPAGKNQSKPAKKQSSQRQTSAR